MTIILSAQALQKSFLQTVLLQSLEFIRNAAQLRRMSSSALLCSLVFLLTAPVNDLHTELNVTAENN